MTTYLADRIREYVAASADPITAARARRELRALAVQVQRMELTLDRLVADSAAEERAATTRKATARASNDSAA